MSEQLDIPFNFIIHGTPIGFTSNATQDDTSEFCAYADFHMANNGHVDPISQPGEKFIKETLQSGALAYSFVCTGIYQSQSERDGPNYAAITLFFPKNTKILEEREFQQKLKELFRDIVLNKYTYQCGDGWRKWRKDFYSLFDGRMDLQIGQALKRQLLPYLSTKGQTAEKELTTEGLNKATQKIQAIEEEIRNLEQALAAKRAQLNAARSETYNP